MPVIHIARAISRDGSDAHSLAATAWFYVEGVDDQGQIRSWSLVVRQPDGNAEVTTLPSGSAHPDDDHYCWPSLGLLGRL